MEKGFDMSIETLLGRLQKVKSTSRGRWVCSCPAHADRSPSMHIQIADDGKILINCKAGCDTYSILQAVGLDWADVMPENPTHHRQKPKAQILYPSEALKLIQFEARIVLVAAYDIAKNKPLQPDEVKRLEVAMQRINKAVQEAAV